MIKRIREVKSNALIASEEFREYVEKFESELVRGISQLTVLSIILQFGKEGAYGYKILKELEEQTNNTLVIDEGTLYPILRNLKRDGLLRSQRKKVEGRKRNYYSITENGKQIFNYLAGFLTKLTEAVLPLFDVDVSLQTEKYYYCPLCANKIDISSDKKYCYVCGYNVYDDLKNRRMKK
ncbi:MAG: PadR family transcriptional regulator [Promethearchaeota archaeon]|nr:MAG: PadR family transcriptional regulator [Candidatus Lokiarchaeota archaeon]